MVHPLSRADTEVRPYIAYRYSGVGADVPIRPNEGPLRTAAPTIRLQI